jgi:hypothetical protein
MIGGRKPLFLLNEDCQILVKLVIEQVQAVGMQTVCSFDLEAVRTRNSGFCCPSHGTAHCTCQMVILQIFGRLTGPLTMTMEGLDHQTWIYLEPGQGVIEEQVDPVLVTALFQAFNNKGILSQA